MSYIDSDDAGDQWLSYCESQLRSEVETIRDASSGYYKEFVDACISFPDGAWSLCNDYGLPEGDYEALYDELH